MEIPAEIQLHDSERWSARLPGLGSAGYQWFWELEEGTGVVEVTLAPLSPSAMPPTGGEPPSTSSTDELVEVRALNPGKAVVLLVQRRSWQADQPPLHQHRIEVVVKG